MASVFIEQIYSHNGDQTLTLNGIGEVVSCRSYAVDFLRKIKKEMEGFVTYYSEKNLIISYKTFRGVLSLVFRETAVDGRRNIRFIQP